MVETARLLHPSPVGTLTLLADDAALRAVLWPDDRRRLFADERAVPPRPGAAAHPMLRAAAAELDAYFAGRLTRFSLPLAAGGTAFQRAVWDALAAIPFGETRTYGAVAEAIGHPRASRAVGAACGMNPLSIVVPCHRVLGSSAALTGFAGGIAAKRFLLEREGVFPVAQRTLPGLADQAPRRSLASSPPSSPPSSPSSNRRMRPQAPS